MAWKLEAPPQSSETFHDETTTNVNERLVLARPWLFLPLVRADSSSAGLEAIALALYSVHTISTRNCNLTNVESALSQPLQALKHEIVAHGQTLIVGLKGVHGGATSTSIPHESADFEPHLLALDKTQPQKIVTTSSITILP